MAHYIVTIELRKTPEAMADRLVLDEKLHKAMRGAGYTHDGTAPRGTYFNRDDTEEDVRKAMVKVLSAVRSVHSYSEGKITRGESTGWQDLG